VALDFEFIGRRKFSALLLGFVFCVGGMAFFFHGAHQLIDIYRLGFNAPTAPGKVLSVYLGHSYGRRSSHRSYLISYSYVVGHLQVTTQDLSVSRDVWQSLNHGDTITVRYLAADPTVSQPDVPGQASHAIVHAWFWTLMPLIFVATGFYSGLLSPKGDERSASP
jgi:hypothetical protein